MTFTLYDATLTYTDGKNNFWLEADRCPLFSKGASTSVHPRKCQRILKHQSKIISNISLQVGVLWKSNLASNKLCSWRIKESIGKWTLKLFSIMEATSSTACDQGLIKRVHVCWGAALSFFYCADLCYLVIYKFSWRPLSYFYKNRVFENIKRS